MINRITVSVAVLTLLFAGFVAQQVQAQSLPSELRVKCASVNTTTKSANCELEVPADTIGSELDISVPKAQLTGLTDLKRGANLSDTSAFFKLESKDSGGHFLLLIDFADINAEAFSTSPYGLVSFTLVLSSVDPSLFPMTIPAEFKAGSKLFDPTALAQNTEAFTASSDLALPIQLVLGDGTEPAPGEVSSTFTFEGAAGPDLRPAPALYCFDDPISSMTDAEWAIICEAKKRGIVSGNPRPDGIFFFPNQIINRGEAPKIVTLGVLRSLGKLTQADFDQVQRLIEEAFPTARFITYIDILYEANGVPPWFAVFVNIATDKKIVHGYLEDSTYRAINKIVNAESYRIIVEAGRVASAAIGKTLAEATIATKRQDWFMKYSETLKRYNIAHSEEYAKFTTRKEFLIIVMDLLFAVGL